MKSFTVWCSSFFKDDSIQMRAWPWLETPISHTKAIVPAGDNNNKHNVLLFRLAPQNKKRNVSLEIKRNQSCQR